MPPAVAVPAPVNPPAEAVSPRPDRKLPFTHDVLPSTVRTLRSTSSTLCFHVERVRSRKTCVLCFTKRWQPAALDAERACVLVALRKRPRILFSVVLFSCVFCFPWNEVQNGVKCRRPEARVEAHQQRWSEDKSIPAALCGRQYLLFFDNCSPCGRERQEMLYFARWPFSMLQFTAGKRTVVLRS